VSGPEVFALRGVAVRFRKNAVDDRSLKRALAGLLRGAARNDHHALDGVHLAVRRGEHVGVVGRNGAGKSTLLRVLARVIHPQAGTVRVDPTCHVVPLLELGIGFQADLSGIENCYLAGALMGYTRREISARLDSIVAFSELGDFAHEPVKNYSSGMYARLAFALATDVEPEALLVDEVFGVGDEFFMEKCVARMRSLMAGGITTVFESHDLDFLLGQCDRLVWLDHGRVVMDGPPVEVAAAYRVARGASPA
jgi:ABC-type polysaccharide/polyol phosphate transport system ATPase subunit